MLSSQTTDFEPCCPPLLRKKKYLPFPELNDLASQEEQIMTDPVSYPQVSRKRPLQEQPPTPLPATFHSSPSKTSKWEPEYDIQDEASVVMDDLIEAKKLGNIFNKQNRKDLRLLIEKLAIDLMFQLSLLAEEEDSENVILPFHDYEIKINRSITLRVDTLYEKLMVFLQGVVLKGYRVIETLYNETKDTSSSSVLRSIKENTIDWNITQEKAWLNIKQVIDSVILAPSYKVYVIQKKRGSLSPFPSKSRQDFERELRKVDIFQLVDNTIYGTLLRLVHELVCQGYVSIDHLSRDLEEYEKEEDNNNQLEEEDLSVPVAVSTLSLPLLLPLPTKKQPTHSCKKKAKHRATMLDDTEEIEKILDSGVMVALEYRSKMGAVMKDFKMAWKNNVDLLHRKRIKKIEELVKEVARTVALDAYNLGREQAGCDAPKKEMKDFFRDRRAAGKDTFIPEGKIGQLTTQLKILAGEAYLDMSELSQEKNEDISL